MRKYHVIARLFPARREKEPRRSRRIQVVGFALAVGLGLAGCSSGDAKSEAKPEPDSKTSVALRDADFHRIAEESLVSSDMDLLSDHEQK